MEGKRRMGGRKKAKESRVVPHPKLNPGCATALRCSNTASRFKTLALLERAILLNNQWLVIAGSESVAYCSKKIKKRPTRCNTIDD